MGKTNEAPDEEDLFVTLCLEDDSEVECRVLTIFEAEEQDYIVLLPSDEENSEKEESLVYIYRYNETDDGEPELENIVDDEEYDMVSQIFDSLLETEEIEDEE